MLSHERDHAGDPTPRSLQPPGAAAQRRAADRHGLAPSQPLEPENASRVLFEQGVGPTRRSDTRPTYL